MPTSESVGLRVAVPVFAAAVTADLLTKSWAVGTGHVLVFNTRPNDLPYRVLMSAVAVAVAVALTRLAAWRRLGRPWGAWVGCALLVAGVLSNGISPFLWTRGVPDFIDVGDTWVWNLADFEIALGLSGGIVALALGACVTYAREALAR